MPRVLRAALFLSCLLVLPSSVRAGVYCFTTSDDDTLRPLMDPFPLPTAQDKVKYRLGTLRMLDDRAQNPELKTSPERIALLERVEKQLEPKHAKGELTLQDRVNLSAAYLRLGRHEKARKVLEESLEQVNMDAPERFLLLANLASAYDDGNPDRLREAILRQRQALAAIPPKPPVPGWSQEQWDRYRIAERYFLKLLELRNGEVARGQAGKWKTVDAIFEKMRFVGPSGEYEAGKLSAESLHELPRDAMPIVVQLMNWLPDDPRLLWLYGELLNADGRVNEAYLVLDELIYARRLSSVREIFQHRQILNEARNPEKKEEVLPPVPPPEEPKKADDNSSKGLPEWRTLLTGFLAGLLVAVFGIMQLFIWFRRRRAPVVPAALERSTAAGFAGTGKSEGIVAADPGHITAPRENR